MCSGCFFSVDNRSVRSKRRLSLIIHPVSGTVLKRERYSRYSHTQTRGAEVENIEFRRTSIEPLTMLATQNRNL